VDELERQRRAPQGMRCHVGYARLFRITFAYDAAANASCAAASGETRPILQLLTELRTLVCCDADDKENSRNAIRARGWRYSGFTAVEDVVIVCACERMVIIWNAAHWWGSGIEEICRRCSGTFGFERWRTLLPTVVRYQFAVVRREHVGGSVSAWDSDHTVISKVL